MSLTNSDRSKGGKTTYARHGRLHFQLLGKKGGRAKVKKGFASNPELAREVALKRWGKQNVK